MGIIKNGVFSGITGTTGGLTGYVLNGQYVVRTKSKAKTRLSEKQIANCQKMSVINEFFFYLLPLLKVGFGPAAEGTTKNYHNVAVSYNKINALKGIYPNIEMDFPKVRISMGNLMPAEDPLVEAVDEGLKFSWHTDGYEYNEGTDEVMVMAYFPELKLARYIRYGAQRHIGAQILKLDNNLKTQRAETYISFVSQDRLNVATSIYTGSIG